ncbi:MAG TPA: hypothetical protein VES36_04715 [Candidatus Limnocylindrales bacterium]|nr:hypothetical protein [Candidatus Limnocylindrales bacterium]
MMMNRRSRLGRSAAVLLAAILAATLSGSVVAEERHGPPVTSFLPCDRPVDPPRCVSVGNDARHFIYIDESVPRGLAAAIRRTMAEDYESTHLRMRVQSRITAVTDVIVFAGDYGENGAAGWVFCPADAPHGVNPKGDRWCQRQELHFNLNPRYAAYFADRGSRDYMACHELGHTIGLRHWGNPPQTEGPAAATCMTPDNPDGPANLHRYDRGHIDRYYALPVPPSTDPAPSTTHATRCRSGS